MVQGNTQVHAYDAARLSHEKLHKTWSIREMLPQYGKSVNFAQSFSVVLLRKRMHVISDRDGRCAVASLSSRLRENVKEELRGVSEDERYGYDHMEI